MTATVTVVANRRFGTHSPLRYPGGKAALAGFFADMIGELGLRDCTYVEPYAGGAGAGVALLREGLVSGLVINDIDPAVHAFWHSVTEDNAAFVDWVKRVPLTIAEWRSQRDVYQSRTRDPQALGRAFFYLNRTNRSGILRAGVIGGQDQNGAYKIDARFNRETLARRLSEIGDLSESIEVSALDGRSVIDRFASDDNAFLYIDPPYVQAGGRLYLNAFDARDHQALAQAVDRIDGAHWLVSYDVSPFISQLYAKHFQASLELNYSARHPGKAAELIVASRSVSAALSAFSPGAGSTGA